MTSPWVPILTGKKISVFLKLQLGEENVSDLTTQRDEHGK